MKTYTLKLRPGYSSIHYSLYDGDTPVADADVTTLFSSDGTAYFVFDFNGASAPRFSDVNIVSLSDANTKLVQFPTLPDYSLTEGPIFKATWRGLPTTYTYREVDTFRELATDEAYGLTSSQLGQLVSLAVSDYSTTEVNTGAKWVDGKIIYKKTYNFGALPDNTTKGLLAGITGLYRVIKMEGYAHGIYNGLIDSTFVLPNEGIRLQFVDGQIEVRTFTTDWSFLTECYITLYYTKSS